MRGKTLWISEAREILKNFRQHRGVTQANLVSRAGTRGYRISVSLVSQMERGVRRLTDANVEAYLAGLDEISQADRDLLAATRAGLSVPDPVIELRAEIAELRAEISELRRDLAVLQGEIRGGFEQTLRALHSRR